MNDKKGSPAFTDSSYASFNGRPRSNSLAIGPSWVDGYVGALPFAVAGLDSIPPGTVTDLAAGQVLDHSLLLGWTAP